MRYKDLKQAARDGTKMDKPSAPKMPPVESDVIEKIVSDKYGLKMFYEDIKDPKNNVPHREELLSSMNNLFFAEEHVKNKETIKRLIAVIDSLVSTIKVLLGEQ